MALPGSTVTLRDTAPPRSAPTDSSVWFITGFTEQGPTTPTLVESMADYAAVFGSRVSYGLVYDSLDVFFHEGGSKAYVARVVGPAAVKATHTFQDSVPANSLIVTAKTFGDWGNGLSVAVTQPDGSSYQLAVSLNGTVVETSDVFTTQQQAVDWSADTSSYVDITLGAGTGIPAIATASLTGGTDDHAGAADANWEAALDLFTKDLGPGQVSMPGRTTDPIHLYLLAHAAANNRVALLDAVDTGTATTLITAAGNARTNGRHGGMLAPWAVVPGLPNVAGTTRTVPYSAVEAGIIARNDSQGESPNLAAAGPNGQSLYAIGLSQSAWNDVDRRNLNDAGVNVARVRFGVVQTYSYKTLADPTLDPNFTLLSSMRLLMEITALANEIGDRYVFSQLDGRNVTLGEFAADLSAEALLPYFNDGSLYGATPDQAFDVDVGAQVNTPSTIAAGQLNAQITLTISPYAEVVQIYITKEAI